MPYRIGEFAGQYEVIKLLGRGACGEVFKVQDTHGGLTYAMKAVPCDPYGPSIAAAARARDAALAEAKLLQGLRHPHVVTCEEVVYDAEQHIVRLILEYMDGGDLQCHIAARRETLEAFPVHFAYRVLTEIGEALNFIHSSGVLHRDVKPANILLTAGAQEIKLGDFGIAKLVEAATLQAASMVGTPYYLSPELIAGQTYGSAADCWALGTCLYEVLSLRRAFEAGNHLALMRLICEESPPALPAETPDDLRKVVYGFLAKEPGQRMGLAEALGLSAAAASLAASPASISTMHTETTGSFFWAGDEHVSRAAEAEILTPRGATLDTQAVLQRASIFDDVDAAATLQLPAPQLPVANAMSDACVNATNRTLPRLLPPQPVAPWADGGTSSHPQSLAPPCGLSATPRQSNKGIMAVQETSAPARWRAELAVAASPPAPHAPRQMFGVSDLRRRFGSRSPLLYQPAQEEISSGSSANQI